MKLKIGNIEEDKKKLNFGTRTLNIKGDAGIIKTPTRGMNNQELKSKERVPTEVSMMSDFSVIFRNFTSTESYKILTDNHYVKNLIAFIENYKIRMQHSSFIFSFLQPYPKVFNDSKFQKEKFLRISANIQREANLKYISFPWLGGNSNDIIKLYDAYQRELSDQQEPIFTIDAGTNPSELEKIIEYIKNLNETGRVNFLSILYKKTRSALPSYDMLWEKLKDSNLGIVLLDVDRESFNMDSLSSSHIQEFILGDIMVTKINRFFAGDSPQKPKPIQLNLKFFNREDLTLLPLNKFKDNSWINNISSCFSKKNVIEHVLQNYKDADNDDEKKLILNSISKTHEFLSSSDEFKTSQKFIDSNETSEYMKSKDILNRNLIQIKSRNLMRFKL